MKGLLVKEFYSMKSHLRQLLIIMLLMGTMFLIGSNIVTAVIVFPIMLSAISATGLAADEQSGWDQQALTLPVPRRSLVLPKYLISYGMVVAGLALSGVFVIIDRLFFGEAPVEAIVFSFVLAVGMTLFFIAVQMPVLIKVGSKNSTVIMMAIYLAFSLLVGLIMGYTEVISWFENNVNTLPWFFIAVLVLLVVLNYVSYRISTALYEKKEF